MGAQGKGTGRSQSFQGPRHLGCGTEGQSGPQRERRFHAAKRYQKVWEVRLGGEGWGGGRGSLLEPGSGATAKGLPGNPGLVAQTWL